VKTSDRPSWPSGRFGPPVHVLHSRADKPRMGPFPQRPRRKQPAPRIPRRPRFRTVGNVHHHAGRRGRRLPSMPRTGGRTCIRAMPKIVQFGNKDTQVRGPVGAWPSADRHRPRRVSAYMAGLTPAAAYFIQQMGPSGRAAIASSAATMVAMAQGHYRRPRSKRRRNYFCRAESRGRGSRSSRPDTVAEVVRWSPATSGCCIRTAVTEPPRQPHHRGFRMTRRRWSYRDPIAGFRRLCAEGQHRQGPRALVQKPAAGKSAPCTMCHGP